MKEKSKFSSRQEVQRNIAVRRAEHFALSNSTPSGVLPGTVDSQKIAGPFRIANEILNQGKRGRDGANDSEDKGNEKEFGLGPLLMYMRRWLRHWKRLKQASNSRRSDERD